MPEKAEIRRMVKNEGGLVVTCDSPADPKCAGYLFLHEGKAYDPSGRVDGVHTQEAVDAHNKVLSRMEIDGLDQNCHVGQGCVFYVNGPMKAAPTDVTTWIGDLVGKVDSAEPYYGGWKVRFKRSGKTMVGKIKKGECYGYFECISTETSAGGSAASSVGAAA